MIAADFTRGTRGQITDAVTPTRIGYCVVLNEAGMDNGLRAAPDISSYE